jgi:hypothetical protein
MKITILTMFMFLAFSAPNIDLQAKETISEKAEATKNDAVVGTKKVYRSAKEKGCRLIHGKMECLGKKIKNRAQNLSEKAESKIKEEKNKVDK